MRSITVCDLTTAIIQSSRPADPAQPVREEPNIKSFLQVEQIERLKGGTWWGREREYGGQVGQVEGRCRGTERGRRRKRWEMDERQIEKQEKKRNQSKNEQTNEEKRQSWGEGGRERRGQMMRETTGERREREKVKCVWQLFHYAA